MIAVEPIALTEGHTLLTLDTWTGKAAEALVLLGYVAAGVIPSYARGSLTPELEPTTVMYKHLSASAGPVLRRGLKTSPVFRGRAHSTR